MTEVARHDGYVVDTPYIDTVNDDISPAWFSMCLLMNGQQPLPSEGPLVWAELGCGNGLNACAIAAANPRWSVWGCDVNPEHIERCRSWSDRSTASNVSFDLASFADLARDVRIGPAEVDVVVVHGVYSWVSEENQDLIASFVRDRLRPGGIVYVSYEVPTGWAAMVPIAEALRLGSGMTGLGSATAFHEAARALLRLMEAGAARTPEGSNESRQIATWLTADPQYAAHEYLGAHFRPVMFDEVADRLATAGCTRVGSVNPADVVGEFALTGPGRDVVDRITDPTLAEMAVDLLNGTSLRRDLFRRGTKPLGAVEHEEAIDSEVFTGLGRPFSPARPVHVPIGDIVLGSEPFEEVLAAVATGAKTIGEIAQRCGRRPPMEVMRTLALLAVGRYVRPVAPDRDSALARRASAALSSAMVADTVSTRPIGGIVSEVLGGGLEVDWLVGHAYCTGEWATRRLDEAMVDAALQTVAGRGFVVMDDGKPASDEDARRSIARQRLSEAEALVRALRRPSQVA